MMTVEFHQRHGRSSIARTIELLRDVHAPAHQYATEHPQFAPNTEADLCYTIGYLTATIGSLLDVLGYPGHGPNLNQLSWLPELDDEGDE